MENRNNIPSEYDDVSYLLEEIKEAEKLSPKEIQALYTLKVKLRHDVPPQHEIEMRAGSHAPKPEEIEKFKSITHLIKGTFTPEEDNIIVRNWKAFCKMHDWDKRNVKPFLTLRNGNKSYIYHRKSRRQFVQFLADGLPNRTLYSVYHRFRNLYDGHLKKRYTPVEDEMIINHIEQNPNVDMKRKYADLAKVLNRTRQSIWRRYQLLIFKRSNKDY